MNPRHLIRAAAAASALAVLAGCAGEPRAVAPRIEAPKRETLPTSDAATLAALDRALAGAHRLESNRARDVHRHPKETLQFFGLREDMAVMEVWPGAGGWYTEVLAPVLKDKGRYLAAHWDPKVDNKFVQDGLKAFRAKLDSAPDVYGKVEVVALQYPGAMAPVPAGSLDMVLTFRNIHNWMPRQATKPMLDAMYAALKPGGILGVVEHRAKTDRPQDPDAKDGYVREDFAIELIESAGFKLVGRSEINANPRDTKDHEQGVWSLPPTLRLGDKDREKYLAIGESDRFTLRFQKPLTP